MLHMATSPTILDSDFRYIDKKGNLLRTRTELTIAQMLTFLEEDYDYDFELIIKDGKNDIRIKEIIDERTENAKIATRLLQQLET